MFCPNCRNVIQAHENYCSKCGEKKPDYGQKVGTGTKAAGWVIGLVGMLVFGLITGVILALI